ncbi:hypothetical protein CHUAL_001745 [Chamberlinius hualienensis]
MKLTTLTLRLILCAVAVNCNYLESLQPVADMRLTSWAEAAYSYVQDMDCAITSLTSKEQCEKLADIDRSQMNVYAAYQQSRTKRYIAVLPDSTLTRHGAHNAILALDPYPLTSFGHLVFIFFIDYGTSEAKCQRNSGIFVDGDCMTIAQKSRCRNTMDKDGVRKDNSIVKRCEINFLPLVQHEKMPFTQKQQQLDCFKIFGFASCPERKPLNETSGFICSPMDSNRRQCQFDTDTSKYARCRVFETCDHAVLIAGGWNRDLSSPTTFKSVGMFYKMLKNNGFLKRNIKTFYANGAVASDMMSEFNQTVFPSAMKVAFRNYIQHVCQAPLCVDSLVIYLNNPITRDGHMLLWDIDDNGQMDSTEYYTLKEFYSDVNNCNAHQVYIFADQSYSGHLVNYFAQSNQNANIIVMGSGTEDDYSYNNEFTKYWATPSHLLTKCITEIHEESHKQVNMSQPTIHDGSDGVLRKTIFGAPCDITPPFTKEELGSSYVGCQNIPTKTWVKRFMIPPIDDEYDYEDEQ